MREAANQRTVSMASGAGSFLPWQLSRRSLFAVVIRYDMVQPGKPAEPVVKMRLRISSLRGGTIQLVREQDRPVECLELANLLPPGIAVVANKMIVFLEGWIIVRRQHLAVCIDIDAVPTVCSRSCSISVRSCPEIRIAGFWRTPSETWSFPGGRSGMCWPCPEGAIA